MVAGDRCTAPEVGEPDIAGGGHQKMRRMRGEVRYVKEVKHRITFQTGLPHLVLQRSAEVKIVVKGNEFGIKTTNA